MTITRRNLLAAATAFALLPSHVFASTADQAEALLALLPDRATAAKLGETWVEREHQQPDAVMQNLQQRLGGGGGTLHDAITEDYRIGAVVKIEGWQIARTQAELCALAYFATTGRL